MTEKLVVKVLALSNMPIAPIMTRLGYREKTSDKEGIFKKYESVISDYARSLKIRLFYVRKKFGIDGNYCDIDGYRFHSNLIRKRFENVREVFLVGASCMPEDFQSIKKFEESGELEKAVILDAVLSEKVDWALDFMERELITEIRRHGQTLGLRLSCGYLDFALDNQKYFYDMLEFYNYGITINENYLLLPEKTVTALLPVKSVSQQDTRRKIDE